jgi:hypothetical protein
VALGVYCDTSTTASYNDLYVECADNGYKFEPPSETNRKIACGTNATFPSASSSTTPQTIPDVGIVTTDYWLTDENQSCFTVISTPTLTPIIAPTAVIAPTKSVPVSPVSNEPNVLPVIPTNNPKPSPKGISAGAAAGGVVGGSIGVLLIVGGFILYHKKQNTGTATKASGRKSKSITFAQSFGASNGPSDDTALSRPVQQHDTIPISNGRNNGAIDTVNQPPIQSNPTTTTNESNITSNAANAATASHPHDVQTEPNVLTTTPTAATTSTTTSVAAAPNRAARIPSRTNADYVVNYKDQARSVIGTPVQAHIPIVIATEVTAAAVGRHIAEA